MQIEVEWMFKGIYDILVLVAWFVYALYRTAAVYRQTCSPLWKEQLCHEWVSAHNMSNIPAFLLPLFIYGLLYILGWRWLKHGNLTGMIIMTGGQVVAIYLTIIWFVSLIAMKMYWLTPFVLFVALSAGYVAWRLWGHYKMVKMGNYHKTDDNGQRYDPVGNSSRAGPRT